MNDASDLYNLLQAAAQVLLRCFVLGFAFLLFWFAAFSLGKEWMYRSASQFDLSPHEINLIHYCGMALVKGWVIVFFLFPYIAIRLVMRKRT
ncbi:MAG TPA: hypothetical protein VFV87_19365 [Pirellulaceae bacterium]|nr:hypothetical protein [Pirellulaceae bacterium]